MVDTILDLVVVCGNGTVTRDIPRDASQMHRGLAMTVLQHNIDVIAKKKIHKGKIAIFHSVVQSRVPSNWLLIVNTCYLAIVVEVCIDTFCYFLILSLLCVLNHLLVAFQLSVPPFVPHAFI